MAYMMNHMWGGWGGGYGLPFFGWEVLLFWLVIFLVIAYLVYKDANMRGMNGPLWGILVLIPMAGLLFLIIYIIIRETGVQRTLPEGKTAMDILKERYARGEITSEQFQTMKEDLKN